MPPRALFTLAVMVVIVVIVIMVVILVMVVIVAILACQVLFYQMLSIVCQVFFLNFSLSADCVHYLPRLIALFILV